MHVKSYNYGKSVVILVHTQIFTLRQLQTQSCFLSRQYLIYLLQVGTSSSKHTHTHVCIGKYISISTSQQQIHIYACLLLSIIQSCGYPMPINKRNCPRLIPTLALMHLLFNLETKYHVVTDVLPSATLINIHLSCLDLTQGKLTTHSFLLFLLLELMACD